MHCVNRHQHHCGKTDEYHFFVQVKFLVQIKVVPGNTQTQQYADISCCWFSHMQHLVLVYALLKAKQIKANWLRRW